MAWCASHLPSPCHVPVQQHGPSRGHGDWFRSEHVPHSGPLRLSPGIPAGIGGEGGGAAALPLQEMRHRPEPGAAGPPCSEGPTGDRRQDPVATASPAQASEFPEDRSSVSAPSSWDVSTWQVRAPEDAARGSVGTGGEASPIARTLYTAAGNASPNPRPSEHWCLEAALGLTGAYFRVF